MSDRTRDDLAELLHEAFAGLAVYDNHDHELTCVEVSARLLAAGVTVSPPSDSLDAAWAEAEAALPEGWRIVMLMEQPSNRHMTQWEALTENNEPGDGEYEQWKAFGPTPAAALRALAAGLRDIPEPRP